MDNRVITPCWGSVIVGCMVWNWRWEKWRMALALPFENGGPMGIVGETKKKREKTVCN